MSAFSHSDAYVHAVPGIISYVDSTLYLRHCQYVLSCMPNEPGNTDFSFAVVAALNGDASSRSFQSTEFPTYYISIFNATTGDLGIVESPDVNDATWEFVAPLAPVPPDATSAYSLKSARWVATFEVVHARPLPLVNLLSQQGPVWRALPDILHARHCALRFPGPCWRRDAHERRERIAGDVVRRAASARACRGLLGGHAGRPEPCCQQAVHGGACASVGWGSRPPSLWPSLTRARPSRAVPPRLR